MKTRLDWIDVGKGIGIFLVVWAHALQGDCLIYKTIYRFHMPLFYVFSGYCYKQACFSKFIKSKITGLYLPLVIATLTMRLYCLLRQQISVLSFASGSVRTVLTLYRDGAYLGATWFMIVLLYALVIYDMINRICKNQWIRYVAVLSLFLIGMFAPLPRIPYYLPHALVAQLFLLVGTELKRKKVIEFCCAQSTLVKVSFATIICILVLYGGLFTRVATSINTFSHPFLFVLISLSGTIGVFCISMLMTSQQHILTKFFKYLGAHTTSIVIWQFIAFKFVIFIQIAVLQLDSSYRSSYPVIYEYNNFAWCSLYICFGLFASILIQKPFDWFQSKITPLLFFIIEKPLAFFDALFDKLGWNVPLANSIEKQS